LLKPADKANKDEEAAKPKHLPEIPVRVEDLKQYAGDYWSDELGVAYRLAIAADELQLTAILAGSSFPRSSDLQGKILVPVGNDTFEIPDADLTLHFQRESAAVPATFVLDAGRTKGMIFRRASGPQ